MLFKELKQGYSLHELDRNGMTYRQHKVTGVSMPHVDMKIAGQTNLVVDVTVDSGTTFVMLSDSDTSYPDGKIISTDVGVILREVNAVKNTCEQELQRADRNKQTIDRCNVLLSDLDPAQREKQQNEARFNSIEDKMNKLMEMMKKITE